MSKGEVSLVFNEPVELQEWYEVGADILINIRRQFFKISNQYEALQKDNEELKDEIAKLREYKAMYEGLCK